MHPFGHDPCHVQTNSIITVSGFTASASCCCEPLDKTLLCLLGRSQTILDFLKHFFVILFFLINWEWWEWDVNCFHLCGDFCIELAPPSYRAFTQLELLLIRASLFSVIWWWGFLLYLKNVHYWLMCFIACSFTLTWIPSMSVKHNDLILPGRSTQSTPLLTPQTCIFNQHIKMSRNSLNSSPATGHSAYGFSCSR